MSEDQTLDAGANPAAAGAAPKAPPSPPPKEAATVAEEEETEAPKAAGDRIEDIGGGLVLGEYNKLAGEMHISDNNLGGLTVAIARGDTAKLCEEDAERKVGLLLDQRSKAVVEEEEAQEEEKSGRSQLVKKLKAKTEEAANG